MTLVAMRLSLVHRATIQRESISTDEWNDPVADDWDDHLEDLPCRLYSRYANETVDRDTVVVIDDLRLIVPVGTDVTEQDRVSVVTSRGESILPNVAQIRAVIRRKDHLQLSLVRIA